MTFNGVILEPTKIKMLFQFAVVFMLALSSVQSFPQDGLSYSSVALELKQAITDIIDAAEKKHVDFNEIKQLPEAYSNIGTIISVLTWIADLLNIGNVEIVYCVREVVEEQENVQEEIRELREELRKLLRLLYERDDKLAECDLIGGDNPTLIDLAKRAACRSSVSLEINRQTAKVSVLALRLRNFGIRVVNCFGCEGPRHVKSKPLFYQNNISV